MSKIIDIPCDVCLGLGQVVDALSLGDRETCITCNGTGDVHITVPDDTPILVVYQEGGQIQDICSDSNVHVIVLDIMEDPIAGKKFGYILQQGKWESIW